MRAAPEDNQTATPAAEPDREGDLALVTGRHRPYRGGWLRSTRERLAARVQDAVGRPQTCDAPAGDLQRSGGLVARWIAFPASVRAITAATGTVATGLAAWGMVALGLGDLGVAAAAAGGAIGLLTASGPLGLGLANRFHRLLAAQRRHRLVDLRGIADGRAVAVRGVVLAQRTVASPLDHTAAVWTLTRLRHRSAGAAGAGDAFFHEVALDFLVDDGTDDPVWIEVAGGMLLDRFPQDRRFRFGPNTLIEIDHPHLTRLRLDERDVRGAEINVCPGDVVEVVGRLTHHLDPTVAAGSGRQPPERRALRSGTRVPVMVRLVPTADATLARVRRRVPRGPAEISLGEPPSRRF